MVMGPRFRGDDTENWSGLAHQGLIWHTGTAHVRARRAYFISSFASAMYIGSETGSLAALAAIGCEA